MNFFSAPVLLKKGDDETFRLTESEMEVLWPFLGEEALLGMSPDFGDLLRFSDPLLGSLFAKPLPLLRAQ